VNGDAGLLWPVRGEWTRNLLAIEFSGRVPRSRIEQVFRKRELPFDLRASLRERLLICYRETIDDHPT
jgi:hypothetical protein